MKSYKQFCEEVKATPQLPKRPVATIPPLPDRAAATEKKKEVK